jgi:hypothetical protein
MHGAATPVISREILSTGTMPGLALDLALVRLWSATTLREQKDIPHILLALVLVFIFRNHVFYHTRSLWFARCWRLP